MKEVVTDLSPRVDRTTSVGVDQTVGTRKRTDSRCGAIQNKTKQIRRKTRTVSGTNLKRRKKNRYPISGTRRLRLNLKTVT